MKPQLGILLPFITFASGSAIALAQSPADRESVATVVAIERTLIDTIARAEPSVVAVSRTPPETTSISSEAGPNLFQDLRQDDSWSPTSGVTGAGVIIDRAGLVLTHYLAVREGDTHTVTTTDGKTHAAEIRASDPRSALAVLAIEPARPVQEGGAERAAPPPATFPAIRLGDAQKLRKGQFVIAIGNPFAIQSDGQATASWGIVTNLARKAPGNTNLNDAPGPNGDYRTTLHHLGTLIQTDARLGWSGAGAALVNWQGELVGITTTAATIPGHEQPAGYAIPMNATFQRIIDRLKEGREVEYGMLGITFDTTFISPESPGPHPVSVGEVFPGMPGAEAGLQRGDVLVRVAGQAVEDIDSMQRIVSSLPPSTSTTIDYERGGRAGSAKATLAKLAVAGSRVATVRPHPWQGLEVDYATALEGPELMQAVSSGAYDPAGCVLVRDVQLASTAWHGGVRPGMFISHVGKKRVSTPSDFHAAVREIGDRFDIRLTQPLKPPSDDGGSSDEDSNSEPDER